MGSLYSAALFDSSMIDLDAPSLAGEVFALLLLYLKVISCVVLNVPVCGDRLEYLHETVSLKMNRYSLRRYLNAAYRHVPGIIRIGPIAR